MEFLHRSFLRRHFAEKPSVAFTRNVSCFLRLPLGPESRNAPRPHGWGQGALRRDFSPSGCKGDYLHTKWLVFISLFLFFFYILFLVLVFFMRLNGTVKYFRWDALSWYFVLQVTAAYIIQAVTIDKKKAHKSFWLLVLGQTLSCSWDEPNSYLGQPKLS